MWASMNSARVDRLAKFPEKIIMRCILLNELAHIGNPDLEKILIIWSFPISEKRSYLIFFVSRISTTDFWDVAAYVNEVFNII
jgi:hypothetical protein